MDQKKIEAIARDVQATLPPDPNRHLTRNEAVASALIKTTLENLQREVEALGFAFWGIAGRAAKYQTHDGRTTVGSSMEGAFTKDANDQIAAMRRLVAHNIEFIEDGTIDQP